MKLFKKGKITDERIVNIQNKIYKEIYLIAAIICMISIFVKRYLYGAKPELAFTEFFVLFISGVYYVMRTASLGIYSDEVEIHDRTSKIPMSVKNIIIGLVSGVVIALFFGIRSALLYGNDTNRLWYFTLVFFTSLIIYCPLFAGFIAIFHAAAKRASDKITQKHQN